MQYFFSFLNNMCFIIYPGALPIHLPSISSLCFFFSFPFYSSIFNYSVCADEVSLICLFSLQAKEQSHIPVTSLFTSQVLPVTLSTTLMSLEIIIHIKIRAVASLSCSPHIHHCPDLVRHSIHLITKSFIENILRLAFT